MGRITAEGDSQSTKIVFKERGNSNDKKEEVAIKGNVRAM